MKWVVILGTIAIILSLIATGAAARSSITAGEPVPLAQLRSLGDVIADAADKQVHILFIHGMRADGSGTSEELRKRLQDEFHVNGTVAVHREKFVLNPWPKDVMIGEEQFWSTPQDWLAAQPFVDRYVWKTGGGTRITVDEVNWWPLLWHLKCRMLLLPEARLAGRDEGHLRRCAESAGENLPGWITKRQLNDALAAHPPLGGGAKGNRWLKQQFLDWGFSDAVIVAGPMRSYVNASMEAAFDYARQDTDTSDYVIISASLGSFALLDAYADHKPSVRKVMNDTQYLYFFANQFALLELARIEGLPTNVSVTDPAGLSDAAGPATAQVQSTTSPFGALRDWASQSAGILADPSMVKQIIAFSDPSDALTYTVPRFGHANISNVYVLNATRWLGLLADPGKAHVGQLQNKALWKAMLSRHPSRPTHERPEPVARDPKDGARRD